MTVTSYTPTEACNVALALIGASPISSIEDAKTGPESICARLYFMVVKSLLSRHSWNFANPVRQLAINADVTPEFGYKYAHKLPSDLLAGPFAVYGNGDRRHPVNDYINANDHIHSNFSQINVLYRSNPDIDTWPAYFYDLVVTALAMRFSKPIADNNELMTEMRIQAFGSANENGEGGLFGAAKKIDAMSNPVKSLFQNGDPLSNTRY